MCKEDVRMKRDTSSRTVTVTPVIGVSVLAFAARRDRFALTFAFAQGSSPPAGKSYYLASGDKTFPAILCALQQLRPFAWQNLEQVGAIVGDTIWVLTDDGAPANVVVTEVYWTKPLSDL